MSRLIVKNLPKGIKEDRLRDLFSEKGQITDCSMKYTQDGVFRKFAFIGYKRCEDAQTALDHFNKTFIDTSRIEVDFARDLGDSSLPRAWSKYSKDSSAFKKLNKEKKEGDAEVTPKDSTKTKHDKTDMLLGDLKDNEKFQEFLEAHQPRSTKSLWNDDKATASSLPETSKGKPPKMELSTSYHSDTDDDEDDENSNDDSDDDNGDKHKRQNKKSCSTASISDLEYLKSKIVNSHILSDDSDDSESDNDDSSVESDTGVGTLDDDDHENSEKEQLEFEREQAKYIYTIKMRGLPLKVKKSQIEDFFKPIRVMSIRLPQGAKTNKQSSVAVVEFSKEMDMEQAMRRNKNHIGQKKIFLSKQKDKLQESQVKARPWEVKQSSPDDEGIEESGRLYVRNLCYSCEESDLEKLFGDYGPLAEVHVPLDSFTKQGKGFAFVSFMMPEHAVKAFSELDGRTFQGRILHILPGKSKKEAELEVTDDMNFKQKKELKQKQQAGSSHNWNSLFLGANAVADIMADKYGTSKDSILDADDRQSLGVRLALGETQVVAETRDFLTEHGIVLDAFSKKDTKERSKTEILVKNLPANTKSEELHALFSKFGTLGRLVLPPSGVTAVVEFAHPSEAKMAFRSLAYTKFHHLPLYLEWAPCGVFRSSAEVTVQDEKSEASTSKETTVKVDTAEGKESPMQAKEVTTETGSMLFVKNLNFDTSEEALRSHFSKCGVVHKVSIAKKKDLKNAGNLLSMGYGFVEFVKKKSADKALRRLQHSRLDDHELELKVSTRATVQESGSSKGDSKQTRPKGKVAKKKCSKILVRNIPFEATQQEVNELFSVFGELKFVRLPKKVSGTSGSHRGFGFVDFLTAEDAKRAFDSLCHSTHLYGRRLVLEWAETEETIDQLRQKTAEHYHDGPTKKKFKKSNILEDLNRTEKN